MGTWGSALLVAGAGLTSRAGTRASASLGNMAATLHAARDPWTLRRLSPDAGEWMGPTRAGLRLQLDELAAAEASVLLIVVAGAIGEGAGLPRLITGAQHERYPDDATLPLNAIGACVDASNAATAVVVIAGETRAPGGPPPAAWVRTLVGHRADCLIVAGALHDGRLLDELAAALAGDAIDPDTGTVTSHQLARHFEHAVPDAIIRRPATSRTVVRPPPLDTMPIALHTRRRRLHTLIDLDDLTGATLPGELRLEALLGRGAFGTVYRAEQIQVGRRVAVKILHAGIDPESEGALLFRQEIRSIGQMRSHPNIVDIYHTDITADGRLFFFMEMLDGLTLHELVDREGTVAAPRAVTLARQLVAGLAAAHAAGIIHADVKPSNAMLVRRSSDDLGERVVLFDFGLARLSLPDRPAEAAGGTRAYMAPEQLAHWRVDARSDVFSAGLVLIRLLTGWQRTADQEFAPPASVFASVDDPALRTALERALAVNPADRFDSAADFAAALGGGKLPAVTPYLPPPFRFLSPLTERDRGRLHGRDREILALARLLEDRRVVIYTAPSGTGKTSLLRAGLIPYLEALGVRARYVSCRPGSPELAGSIRDEATTVAAAVAAWHAEDPRRLAIIVDQVEALLDVGDDADDHERAGKLDELLGFDQFPEAADVSVVLSVREDFVGRLLAATPLLARGAPQERLRPLDREQARNAIVRPLSEHRLAIAPELLDELLDDLVAAGRRLGVEVGWDTSASVYPPHLQLVGSVLHAALTPLEATVTAAHYRALGGFDAIVSEHLSRVLAELPDGMALIARELFIALVTSAHTRAVRSESELLDTLAARFPAAAVLAVLEALRARGLVVRLRGRAGEPVWELIHDSLVRTIEGWLEIHDLGRRRVAEVVRFHLRQSTPEGPSLLTRSELGDVARHNGIIGELELEWSRRPAQIWTPRRLVERSRRVWRHRAGVAASTAIGVLAITGLLLYNIVAERAMRRREAVLRDRDLGRVVLDLRPFEWDPVTQQARFIDAADLPALAFRLHEPADDDPDAPGPPIEATRFLRGQQLTFAGSLLAAAEVRAGDAILVVDGRAGKNHSACPPSVIRLRRLPGHALRAHPTLLTVPIPTCAATLADTLEIPPGPYIFGGVGDPASRFLPSELPLERFDSLPAYRIDRTEVTNAAFQLFADLHPITGFAVAEYPVVLRGAADPRAPRTDINVADATAYCRYLGKTLQSSEQWTKAMRGGLQLPGGLPNPMPRRSAPWGAPLLPAPTRLDNPSLGVPRVDEFLRDVSPYGVVGLGGTVQEWTSTLAPPSGTVQLPLASRSRVTRGANWANTPSSSLADFMATENPRSPRKVDNYIGARCTLSAHDVSPPP